MATHGTIDLETIDTSPSATVLSLGAIKFNPLDDSEPHSELYLKIDIDQQDRLGRTVSDSTIEWWGKQDAKQVGEVAGTHAEGLSAAIVRREGQARERVREGGRYREH